MLYLRPLDLSMDETMQEILDAVKRLNAPQLGVLRTSSRSYTDHADACFQKYKGFDPSVAADPGRYPGLDCSGPLAPLQNEVTHRL